MPRLPVNSPYTITTQFGVPDSNAKFGRHSGIDYAGFGSGRPIHAPAGGQLTNVVSSTGGNMVVIKDSQGYYHRLMHNSSFSRGNGAVNEGAEVAKAGTTGLSTGVHCHWDINKEGTYPTSFAAFINPNNWLKQGADMINRGDITNIWRLRLPNNPPESYLKFWEGKSWHDCFYDLVRQPEFANAKSLADENTIKLIYNSALFRNATSTEVSNWLSNRITNEALLRAVLGSSEYAKVRSQWEAGK